ncbi:MAG: hypothetical protein PF447_01455 [Spirochaetaceae bacterium]|jgi:hypothetical protein|nr:hypothetical protein [Spirochaetaceae bacterium]
MSKNITEGGSDSRSNTTYPYLEHQNQYSIMIASKDNPDNTTDGQNRPVYTNLEHVKPGDVVFYGEDGDAAFNGTYQPAHQGAHIMIVQDVTYHEDGSVTPDGISLIESVYIANICYVTKSRTLNHNKIIDRTWFIVRLESN